MSTSVNKYHREVVDLDGNLCKIDVYTVLEAFAVACPARQHAIKKLLCSGIRGKGDVMQDLNEANASVSRAVELQNGRKEKKTEAFVVELSPGSPGGSWALDASTKPE